MKSTQQKKPTATAEKQSEKITFVEFKKRFGLQSKLSNVTIDTQTYEALKEENESAAKTINDYHITMQDDAYMSADDLSAYKTAINTYTTTGRRLRQYYKQQGYTLDEENENSWQNTVAVLRDNYDLSYEHYSKFASLEDFTKDQENRRLWDIRLAEDTDVLQQELDDLKAMAEVYLLNHQQLSEYLLIYQPQAEYSFTTGKQYINEHQAKAIDNQLRTLEWKYGFDSPSSLENLIAQKTAYLAETKRLQAFDTFNAVADPTRPEYDPEFEEYCTYKSTKVSESQTGYFDVENPDFYGSQQFGEANSGYADVTYEFINGNQDISELLVGTHNNYSYLTDAERKVYNYYYRKFGRQSGEAYLVLLEDSLNHRAAKEAFKKFEDNTVLEMVFAVEAGLDQFASGLSSLTNLDGEYKATSKTQYLSGMIREDLGDKGISWYNFNTKQWEKQILGSSLGQIAYDTISTTANMAPSLLAATAVGMVSKTGGAAVGSVLMGASSGGNAYQQKLNMGYTQEQAAAYGLLIGVSETILEFTLDKVGALGGAVLQNLDLVDDVLGRFSQSAGGKMLINAGEEGFEECLQAILEPFLWETVSGEEMTVDRQDVLYSALLGFVSGGIFGATADTDVNSDSNTQVNAAASTPSANYDSVAGVNTGLDTEAYIAATDSSMATPTDPGIGAASDIAAADSSTAAPNAPQTDAQSPGNSSVEPTTQQILERAMENMHSRPMDPKTYNALFSYKNQLQHTNTTQTLLDQKRGILQQQQASGASDAQIKRTMADIAKLENMLSSQKETLQRAEQDPRLQQVIEKYGAEIVENRRKKDVDISQTSDKIETNEYENSAEAEPHSEAVRVKCRNERLDGQNHPVTGVRFVRKQIKIAGKQLQVVVPQFESHYDAQLPEDMLTLPNPQQFREANRQLLNEIANNPELRAKFNQKQLADLARLQNPEGYSWHHAEETGKLQLVDSKIHEKTGHTGGRRFWGRGTHSS